MVVITEEIKGFRSIPIDPRSGYDLSDIVRLFIIIRERPRGRIYLISKLRLGEATVKTMLKNLKNKKLVKQNTLGVYPAKRADQFFSFCDNYSPFKEVHFIDFSEKPSVALIVNNGADSVNSGIEQRDEGVKHGAKIITLVKRSGKLILAGVPEHPLSYKEQIESLIKTVNGDVLILSSAETRLDAERGAIAASLTLGE